MFPPLSEIRIRRNKLGWTQTELAKRSGVSQSAINKIENGNMEPSYSIVVKIFNALDEGEKEKYNGKRAGDLMNRNVISVTPGDKVKKARELMKKHGISQIPVIDGKTIVGMVTEQDILDKLEEYGDEIRNFLVMDIMGKAPLTVRKNTSMNAIIELLKEEQALMVTDRGRIAGIITRADVIYKGVR